MYQVFDFSIDGGVAHIVMKDAARGNPIDEVFCRELNAIAIECDENSEVRAVLLSAEGRFFSVGGDLATFSKDRERLPHTIKRMTSDMHMAVSRLSRMKAPLVVAIHALAAGGAVSLCAAADFALAAPNSEFYGAFGSIGFSCDCGTSYFLPRRVGVRKAAELLMLNQKWSAQQALEAGLINRIVEQERLLEEAQALAAQLAAGPTQAYACIKQLLLSSFSATLETQLETEARYLSECGKTDDAWNAMASVINKQRPVFAGK